MQTDYEKVNEKLRALGAGLISETISNDADFGIESPFQIQIWAVGKGFLIVLGWASGGCGLFSFVGKQGAPVETDLHFIDYYAVTQT